MGKRSTARRLAMQTLYQLDLGQDSFEKVLDDSFQEQGNFIEETKVFARRLVEGTIRYRPEIDGIIKSLARDWPLERIGVVDRNILRLAIYELNFDKENPPSVVINEAVELAKKYSTPEAAKFINGILGGVLKARKKD